MKSTNPRILNLDELEFAESDIKIVYEGKEHAMRTLTVEMFIAQQKRAADHEKMVAAGKFDEDQADVTDIVTLIRDAVIEFFPTLPADKMETTKLFSIFAWLNEMSAHLNAANAPESDSSAEGNEEVTQTES